MMQQPDTDRTEEPGTVRDTDEVVEPTRASGASSDDPDDGTEGHLAYARNVGVTFDDD